MNAIIISGNMCGDPEAKTTKAGKELTTFRVAVRRKFKNANGEYETDFFNVTCFGHTATFTKTYGTKGAKCIVQGELHIGQYTAQDGSKRQSVDLIADDVELISRKPDTVETEHGTMVEDTGNDDDLPF